MRDLTRELIFSQLNGMNETDVIELCKKNVCEYRVVREDSDRYIVTMDHHPDRINLELDNGVVTSWYTG
jgi:hypothetical protein